MACKCLHHIGKAYCSFSQACNYLQSPFLLLIRLYWGWNFVVAGFGKLMNLSQTAEFFGNLGIPMPYLNATLAASAEFGGGLLLILGLFSRFGALVLVFTMCVAYATAHLDAVQNLLANPEGFTSQTPFLFLYAAFIVLAFGAGFFSLDALMQRVCRK